METLLRVDKLSVTYRTPQGVIKALRDVSLEIQPGQVFGVVGESGSGKTSLALAILRYLPASAEIQAGTVHFNGQDLSQLDIERMRKIWGAQLGFVPQDPESALNPTLKVGEQVAEVLRRHRGLSKHEANNLSLTWLERVRLPEPAKVASSYPHQLSGGMQQRVMIASALCIEPALLILDEPTTNLDATTQAVFLDLISELIADQKTAAMYITHNLGVVAKISDELAVLYAGEIVERGPTRESFRFPHHPYTRGLLDSVPRLGKSKNQLPLRAIQGRIPPLDNLPVGCVFRERCPLAIDICVEPTPLYVSQDRRASRCHRWQEIAQGVVDAGQIPTSSERISRVTGEQQAVLTVDSLSVAYARRRSLFHPLIGRAGESIKAVKSLSFEIQPGETLGLVGESGSGKSTAARAILGLEVPQAGRIDMQGQRLAPRLRNRSLDDRGLVQMVFQNANEAFNPYQTVGESLRRPLIRLLNMRSEEATKLVVQLLESVQLPASYAQRFPGSLSGGERQRVAIARAFASSPALLLADEAVSALDVSVQAAILNLLGEMQASNGSAILFISHDLGAVGYIADHIAVIYLGQLMQLSSSEDLFQPPYHPYTEALLSAIPLLDPEARQERIRLEGDLPDPTEITAGCPFESRCPRRIGDICRDVTPPWQIGRGKQRIFCHIPIEELEEQQSQVFQFRDATGGAE